MRRGIRSRGLRQLRPTRSLLKEQRQNGTSDWRRRYPPHCSLLSFSSSVLQFWIFPSLHPGLKGPEHQRVSNLNRCSIENPNGSEGVLNTYQRAHYQISPKRPSLEPVWTMLSHFLSLVQSLANNLSPRLHSYEVRTLEDRIILRSKDIDKSTFTYLPSFRYAAALFKGKVGFCESATIAAE